MKTDKQLAAKLTQDVGDFLRAWGHENTAGPMHPSIALSALGSLLAYTVASIPDEQVRLSAFHSLIKLIAENSDANAAVVVQDGPAGLDALLAAAEPQGRA